MDMNFQDFSCAAIQLDDEPLSGMPSNVKGVEVVGASNEQDDGGSSLMRMMHQCWSG